MKKPIAFIIFTIALIASLTIIVSAFITTDMLLAMLLSGVLFLTMILAIVGFVLGLKFKSEDAKTISLNKIGTMGNMSLSIIIFILLFIALI